MSDFNELKKQFLSRVAGANNLSELRQITSAASDEFRSIAWAKPKDSREKSNEIARKTHERVWEERLSQKG